MPAQLVGILFGLSVTVTGILLANRAGYMQNFRTHDLNFTTQLNLSKAASSPQLSETQRKTGKLWLRLSEHYRHASLFLTFSIVYGGIGAILLLISFVIDSVFENLYFLAFLIPAFLFLGLGIVAQVIRYRRFLVLSSRSQYVRRLTRAYMKASFKLAHRIPMMDPEHIARHPHIQEVIDKDPDIINFLQQIDYSEYLWLIPRKWPGPYTPMLLIE